MSASMDNVRTIITLAETNNGFIHIKGYESRGSGQIADVTVQPLGEKGYEKLLNEAIADSASFVKPDGVDDELWNKALTAQIKSWQKSLDGEHNRKNNFEKQEKGFYGHSENDAIYIKNVVIVKKEVIKKGEFKKVNSAPLTILKAKIRKMSRIGKYQGSYKLEMGTFESVSFKGVKIKG
jgi:hypothetical protein